MSDVFVLAVDGIDRLPLGKDWTDAMERASIRAVNAAARRGRTISAEEIERQVNYPRGYLAPRTKRLQVTKQAKRSDPEAAITGNFRPTSLARFVQGNPGRGQRVTVNVGGQRATFGRNAFLIKLRAGNAPIETRSNLGLAIRLKPGETMRGKREVTKMRNGLYLLYGPSVNQVFFKVRDQKSPEIADYLVDELERLLDLEGL